MKKLDRNFKRGFCIIFIVCFVSDVKTQINEEWTHRYTGPKASTDTPSNFVTDDEGNIYLTGQSSLDGGYSDIVTVKFNSSGVRQWITKYDGPANQHDNGNAVVLDHLGNVYVVGSSSVQTQNFNLVLIKYNSSGEEQWVQNYNGSGNFVDLGIDLKIDANGNIYAGGYSHGTGTAYDFVLLKFNSSGQEEWVKRWNGTSNSDDYLLKIELASNGDILVAGTSYNNITVFDFVTLRYNPSGSLIWTQIYNGPPSMDDYVSDIQLDMQNNVYVCGRSRGTGTNYDYTLVKYNFAGVHQWTDRYNGSSSLDDSPSAMDIDANGNVYVTGSSHNGNILYLDYATIKYNPEGVRQWISFFNGIESYFDFGVDVKADEQGNVYVTGQCLRNSDGTNDIVSVKYGPSGNKIWDKTYNGPGDLDDRPTQLGIDKSGGLILIANSYSYFFSPLCGASDYLILKYNSNGNMEFETRFDGSGTGTDEAVSVFTDNTGNSYVTGFSFDEVTGYDYATLKYNSSGAPLWAMRYDGGYGADKATSVTADINGNVYVTGTSQGSGGNNDIVTVKYNSAGFQQWERRYNGTANGDDIAAGMAIDESGNSYVTGYSDGAGSGKDYVTIKYSAGGIQQWASKYNGTGNSNDLASSIILDGSGNSYVTGKSTGAGSSQDIATVKYNSSGVQQWAAVFNGSANDSDEAICIELDLSGNVLVGGKTKSIASGFDFVTLKYNSTGALQWMRTLNGTLSNSNDEITSIATDESGNIFAGGNAENLNSGYDFTAMKYSPTGNLLWVSSHDGTSGTDDKLSSICVDLAGNAYAAGFTNDIGTGKNMFSAKYNHDGKFVWTKVYNYIDNDSDKASDIKVDIGGNVYVTGISTSIESKRDFFTIKYSQGKSILLKALIEGLYDESFNVMISDTVKVVLRNAAAPFEAIDSSTAVLNSSGNGIFNFSNVQNNTGYYIVLNHRNSIETWSSAPISFFSNSMNFDFTAAVSQAYGNNLKQKGNKFCIYSGDVVRDGIVDLTDLVLIFNAASAFATGYHAADVNGDESVDLTDLILTYNNSSLFASVVRP